MAAGGIKDILNAMASHPNSAGVQEQACGALERVTNNLNDYKHTIAALGGIDLILNAMVKHAGHAGVCERACKVLGNLAVFHPPADTRDSSPVSSAGSASGASAAGGAHRPIGVV